MWGITRMSVATTHTRAAVTRLSVDGVDSDAEAAGIKKHRVGCLLRH
jgi:hypothetical protein